MPGLRGQRLKHLGLVNLDVPEKVEEIIDKEHRTWKLEEIQNWISTEEKNDIEVIPIGEEKGKYILVWPYNGQGIYTVKSGYKVLKQEKKKGTEVIASSSHNIDKVWNAIWSLNVPSKIRIFFWRLCSDELPCCAELWKRRIRNLPDCPLCQNGGRNN